MRKDKRIDGQIVSMLETSGLKWSLEDGKKHIKLFVEGHMVNVFPTPSSSRRPGGRQLENSRAQVRRYLRSLLGRDI